MDQTTPNVSWPGTNSIKIMVILFSFVVFYTKFKCKCAKIIRTSARVSEPILRHNCYRKVPGQRFMKKTYWQAELIKAGKASNANGQKIYAAANK
jgi:hypothetical protein